MWVWYRDGTSAVLCLAWHGSQEKETMFALNLEPQKLVFPC